jgi:hypothetical protein
MAGDQPRNRGEGSGGALKVSPQEAHRHAVSLVISLASVLTLADPHAGQVGRVETALLRCAIIMRALSCFHEKVDDSAGDAEQQW